VLWGRGTSFEKRMHVSRASTLIADKQTGIITSGARIAQSVWRLATGWTVLGSYAVGGEILFTHPERCWGPPSLLQSGTGSVPESKAAGAWRRSPSPPT